MHGKSLYDFYEKFLLPQFGIGDNPIEWASSEDIGSDETVHYFSTYSSNLTIYPEDYALIFEDYVGLGSTESFVREHVKLKNNSFEYVNPTSYSDSAPSYNVTFPTPSKYCVNVTGAFTLVLLGQSDKFLIEKKEEMSS